MFLPGNTAVFFNSTCLKAKLALTKVEKVRLIWASKRGSGGHIFPRTIRVEVLGLVGRSLGRRPKSFKNRSGVGSKVF